MLTLGFFLQDRYLGLEIGWLNVRDQTPLKSAAQAVFEVGEFFGRSVAGDHDLLHAFM